MSEGAGLWVSIFRVAASWLPARLLRLFYPERKCCERVRILVSGIGSVFEMRKSRPTPALIGLQIAVVNLLPFEIDVELRELEIRYESQHLKATLNKHVKVVGPGVGSVDLGEFDLSDPLETELYNFGKGGAHLYTTIRGTVESDVRNFDLRADLQMKAMVNCDWKLLV
jgi:hypothetical protein